MKKIINHIKNNILIYIIIIICAGLIGTSLYVVNNHQEEKVKVETEYFINVNIKEALSIINTGEPSIFLLSYNDCSATAAYVDSLRIAQARFKIKIYYVELYDIDKDSEEYKEFKEKLNFEYNFNGKTDKFYTFIGATPMTIVFKNQEMVYGFIGSMTSDSIEKIVKLYGV